MAHSQRVPWPTGRARLLSGRLESGLRRSGGNEMLKEFHQLGAELIGISVDGAWCHAAFARDRKLHFPLLADFEPKGDVARRYGVYRDKDGVSERALFVIDADGKVHWSFVSPIGVNPGADGILSALEDLQNKQAMPEAAEK